MGLTLSTTLRAPLLAATFLVAAAGAQIAPTEFVDEQLVLPDAVLAELGELLPSMPNGDSPLLATDLDAALTLSAECAVSVVYLANTAGREHAFGYFTYSESPLTIHDRQLVFPRANDQALTPGMRSVLRDADGEPRVFPAGTKLGFFLVRDGWKSQLVKKWKAADAVLPALDPAANAAGGKSGLVTSIEALNPEYPHSAGDQARHAVLAPLSPVPGFLDGEPLLALTFEDDDRTLSSDNDFNDLALLLRSHAPAALGDGLPVLPAGDVDSDADGVPDALDAYPQDPERAMVENVPGHGLNVIGLEDLYPVDGDGDFNDAVLAYRFQLVKDAAGNLREVLGSFHLLARGGSLIHRLGLHLPGLPPGTPGTLQVERFLEDAAQTHELDPPLDLTSFALEHDRRLETLLPNSHHAIAPLDGAVFVNTESELVERPAASSRVLFRFDVPVPPSALESPPYDLYWSVYDGARWVDVHLAGVDAFDDHPDDLPVEQGGEAFLDEEGFPWMLEVPYDFRFPVEHASMLTAYPHFRAWAASKGTEHQDWADHPAPGAALSAPAEEYLVPRDWSLTLPSP